MFRQDDKQGRTTDGDRLQIRLPGISEILEIDPQGQLTNPCSILSTADLAKGRAVGRLIWTSQPVFVESVKQLDAELCRYVLRDGVMLDETEVRVRANRKANAAVVPGKSTVLVRSTSIDARIAIRVGKGRCIQIDAG